jgi:hypothetical protein
MQFTRPAAPALPQEIDRARQTYDPSRSFTAWLRVIALINGTQSRSSV